jgi:hypothetical protein
VDSFRGPEAEETARRTGREMATRALENCDVDSIEDEESYLKLEAFYVYVINMTVSLPMYYTPSYSWVSDFLGHAKTESVIEHDETPSNGDANFMKEIAKTCIEYVKSNNINGRVTLFVPKCDSETATYLSSHKKDCVLAHTFRGDISNGGEFTSESGKKYSINSGTIKNDKCCTKISSTKQSHPLSNNNYVDVYFIEEMLL